MPAYFAVALTVSEQSTLRDTFNAADLLSVGSKPVGGVWYVRVDDDEDVAAPNRFTKALIAAGIPCSAIEACEFWSSRSDPF
jgi:hypothetical protein